MTGTQTMILASPSSSLPDPSSDGGGVNDPRIIGGVVGGLAVVGLLILGALLLRRRGKETMPDSNAQAAS